MARTVGKFGKKDPDHSRPALKLSAILKAAAPVPSAADYVSEVDTWPMYLNDSIGDCAIAAPGHAIEGWTRYAQGKATVLVDNDILKGYEAVSGYDPSKTDKNGNNPTDTGCVLQDVFDYWRKTGIGGDKILFFAKVDPQNPSEVASAIYYFGHIIYGIQVPQSAMDQFNDGQAWDVVSNDGGSLGGHAVNVGKYTSAKSYVAITWGSQQQVTQAFFQKYSDEAWVVATLDWVKDGVAPTGLDTGALNEAFSTLTGEAGPFPVQPAPAPTPTPPEPEPTPTPPEPVPTPPPTPEPPAPVPTPVGPDDADEAVAPVIEDLAGGGWVNRRSRAALREWLKAKGFCS